MDFGLFTSIERTRELSASRTVSVATTKTGKAKTTAR